MAYFHLKVFPIQILKAEERGFKYGDEGANLLRSGSILTIWALEREPPSSTPAPCAAF